MPDERSRDEAAKLRDVALLATQAFVVANVALANNVALAMQDPYSNSVVFIGVGTDEAVAIYLLSASGVATEASDPMGLFTAVKDTAASINIYYEAGRWMMQNKRGGARSICAVLLRLAPVT